MFETIKDFLASLFSGFKSVQSDGIKQNKTDLESMKKVVENDDNQNSHPESK